jgi:hypothetical protein
MENITTAAESTVSGAAIEQLLFTTDWLTGVRATANIALTERTDYADRLAYALSGGGELHPDAHSAAVANLLHSVAPGIVAFALHHLRPLLPDLSDNSGPGSTRPPSSWICVCARTSAAPASCRRPPGLPRHTLRTLPASRTGAWRSRSTARRSR